MALSITHISLVLLAMSVYLIASTTATQSSYPSGSLACKTYNMTKMDCSNRNLPDVPVLDQNWTTSLDLSHNQLRNITNAPFEKLQILLMLNLSYNEISQMSSTSFRGLHLLEILDLQDNMLADLPHIIFSDLHNLQHLDMDKNWLTGIPGQVLAPLYSLRYFWFKSWANPMLEIDLKGFENMSNLYALEFSVESVETNITSNLFHPLRNLPLRVFTFKWMWGGEVYSLSKDIFSPLTSKITRLQIQFTTLPALLSLQYPCETLLIMPAIPSTANPQVIDNSSLRILQMWNTSLEILRLRLLTLEGIEDYTFVWMSNLHLLDLHPNQISYLAKDAFYGLNSLQQLILYNNLLIHLPTDALEVFRKLGSLQYLDLSSNRITKLIDQDSFSAVSTSLSYLNVEINNKLVLISIDWISVLPNLKHLILTCTDSDYCGILINLERSLPSLKKIQIINHGRVNIERPLCTLFPSLEVSKWSSHSGLVFPLLEAIKECSNLRELVLSGTLQKNNFVDFTHVNITMPKLKIMTLARNKLSSVKLIFFIKAPKLTFLDLVENSLKTIDSEIANKYPGLITLNIQDNELTSLSGLEQLTFLQNLKAGSNEITEIPTWLLSKAHSLQTLDLNNNPFQCTCKIEHFREVDYGRQKNLVTTWPIYVCHSRQPKRNKYFSCRDRLQIQNNFLHECCNSMCSAFLCGTHYSVSLPMAYQI